MIAASEFKAWYDSHKEEIARDFFKFLRFRSVGTEEEFKQETLQTAEWLRGYLEGMGLETTLWKTPGFPVVFAQDLGAGPDRPTVLIYHHYDVQPVDPLELWESPPFEPAERDGKIYARGAADNKGQCFYSLMAIKAWLELAKEKNVNLKVFIEGEEEAGSKGTAAILKERAQEMKADYLLVVDCGIPDRKTPAVTLGIRGMVTWEVICTNARTDLHSGMHGGIALNPNRALATLLAGLWDEKGRVTLDGFYDDVKDLSASEMAKMDTSFDEKGYKKAFGVGALAFESGYSAKASNGLRPSLEINGMIGGYTGPGFKTIIPAVATAKISCRLVPDQDPDKVMRQLKVYFEKKAPEGLKVDVKELEGAPAYRSSLDSPLVKTVALSYKEIFKTPCQYLCSGGSIPIVSKLKEASGADVALMGVGLDEDDIHAPNEHFDWERFELGFLTMGQVLSRL